MAKKTKSESDLGMISDEILKVQPTTVQPIQNPAADMRVDGNSVAINRVWHLRELNYRRDLGDNQENVKLRKAMFEVGQWSASNGIVVFRSLPDERYTHEKLVQLSLDAMKAHHQSLKTAAMNKNPTSVEAQALKGFEVRWINPADKSYFKPDLFGGTGFRRGSKVLDEVNGMLISANRPIIDRMYVTLKSFATMAEFHREQRLENESAKEGSLEVSMLDRLRSALTEWHSLMSGPTDIVKMGFAYGTAQKLYGILRLNEMYPDLNVIGRILRPSNDPEYLPFNRFDKEVLRPYYKGDEKKGIEMKSKEDFIKLLESFGQPKQAKAEGATKAQIEMLPKAFPTSDVHKAFHRFLTAGDVKFLDVLKGHIEPLNMVYALAYAHVDPKLICEALKPLLESKQVEIKPNGLVS